MEPPSCKNPADLPQKSLEDSCSNSVISFLSNGALKPFPGIGLGDSYLTSAPYGGFDSIIYLSLASAYYASSVGGSLNDIFMVVSGLKTLPAKLAGGRPSAPTTVSQALHVLFKYASRMFVVVG